MKKYKFLLLTTVLMLSLTMIGFAATTMLKLDATSATDMSLTVDQAAWQPMDTDGSALHPVIIKGRSYLPVRALLDKFGIGVVYDDKTKTIQLTSKVMDKSSPKLAEILFDPKPDTAMSIEYNKKKLGEVGKPKLTQVNTFELAESAEIWVDGALSKVNLQDISLTKYDSVSVAKVEVDKVSGQITKLEITTDPTSDTGTSAIRDVRITITITSPPLRITITISW